MNQFKKATRWLLISILLSLFAIQAQSACTFFDAFVDNYDGTLTDPRSGLTWKRCTEDMVWTGTDCQGTIKTFTWFEAMLAAKGSKYLNKDDWRLATKSEYESILGKRADCRNNNVDKGEYAVSKKIEQPIIHTHNGKLARYLNPPYMFAYWSSESSDENNMWVANFDNAAFYKAADTTYLSVRLVRGTQPAGDDGTQAFNRFSEVYYLNKLIEYKESGDVQSLKQASFEASTVEKRKIIEEMIEKADYRRLENLIATGNESSLKQAYNEAKTPEQKKLVEAGLVKQYSDKLLSIKYSTKGLGDAKAYGGTGSGGMAEVITQAFGYKVGTEGTARVDYRFQLDEKILKIANDYQFTADVTLTASGEGYYENHCMWPLPSTCKNKISQETYTEKVTGILYKNLATSGGVSIVWQPKYERRGMSGLTRYFVTSGVNVKISNVEIKSTN